MQQMQLKHHQRRTSISGNGSSSGDEETCRFPKLQECAHFHYERVQLCPLQISLQTNTGDFSIHSLQHTARSGSDDNSEDEWYTVQVTSNNECWLLQRNLENFVKLDSQLHQCIYDRKVSLLPELTHQIPTETIPSVLTDYLSRFCSIIDNSLNCGPVLTWFQLDNRGHRLLVPNEESDSINTPAVAAAYSIKKYISQARDELNLEVGDMISVIDMASPGESMWWRGKRGFQVGFFPQHCVHVIGEKLACLPQAPNALGAAGAVSPIKPVLRKHGKLIAFFRSFILNRPSRRRLKQSGILRERVFGCDLGEHLLNSDHEIPMVLKCCAEFIESHGIVDGIYRLSGVTSNIQKLRNAFDEDRIPNLYTEDILQDIHSVASLLKMYFRELPNPLCTYQLYHSFVNAVQGTQTNSSGQQVKIDKKEQLLRMRETVHKLPPPHYRTLEYLMRHLARVAKHGTRTGMTSRNVAIVWAPNLLRCAELEVGGVAALQGVGVQAVVTEFLVCYTDLIFCDNLPNIDSTTETELVTSSPRKLRPKSLALSTPTKLLSLEEARSKHLLGNMRPDESSYIEVGGGPKNLPEKYHTVLELPSGFRKRSMSKRSPLGWRSFFTKSRNTSHTNLTKNAIVTRKASTPGLTTSFQEKSVTESDLTEIRRKLRPVKSAESLISGQSEPASTEIDTLGPLHCLNKPSGHNRSVSHDSYFDTLQASNNNSEGSLLDLSELQLNFELEESEMRIFSEDESLVSSPRVVNQVARKVLQRARPEEYCSTTSSNNPSPKKQPRVVLSPESHSRKRSRLEDQLSDILYIDCNTPENMICTTAIVHTQPEKTPTKEPKNKSPRNRNSLNLETNFKSVKLPKSLTEFDLKETLKVESVVSSTNITPQTPKYNRLGESESSGISTPEFSTESPADISYKTLNRISGESKEGQYENVPSYENVLTTISITYSPTKNPKTDNIYEDVAINSELKATVPTSVADLPLREASQPSEVIYRTKVTNIDELLAQQNSIRPTSLALTEENPTSFASPIRPISLSFQANNYVESPAYENVVEKRKSCETEESVDEDTIYQQVKYFRRSIHEINKLLDKPLSSDDDEVAEVIKVDPVPEAKENDTNTESDRFDSLEIYNDPKPETVREIASKFEPPRESLPPCLRARNAKLSRNNSKTRSLDENEFIREFCSQNMSRRKSFDEHINRVSSERQPKILNQPKLLPDLGNKSPDYHSLHSLNSKKNILKETNFNSLNNMDSKEPKESSSTNSIPASVVESTQLNRERIEKYKEERRNFLREKYRSESFRAEKDQILTRLKQKIKPKNQNEDGNCSGEEEKDSLEYTTSQSTAPSKPLYNHQKIIETYESQMNQRLSKRDDDDDNVKLRKKVQQITNNSQVTTNNSNDTLILNNVSKKKELLERQTSSSSEDSKERSSASNGVIDRIVSSCELRRHTFDTIMMQTRERENEQNQRISLESKIKPKSPKREKRSPSYIKDMTAMFESKSTQ